MTSRPHAVFISHGGGPLPLLGDLGHSQMVSCLQGIAASIPRPTAIVVVSAHWEAPVPTITGHHKPPPSTSRSAVRCRASLAGKCW